jgi:hypothetical protein
MQVSPVELVDYLLGKTIYENKTQGEAKDSVRQKLERKWKKLHFENSKKIIKPKYEAAMLLLK